MNLKRLEYLIAVAEEGSLAAAARRVHLSQPALTRSIQALEAEAGMPLFDRGARGVSLTSAGRMVAERARRILFETRCLARDLTLVSQHEIGSVQLGMGPFPAAILLPEVLSTMSRDWPKLRITAEVNSAPALLAALHAETLDFVVAERRTIPPVAELEVRRLRPERSGWFVRPDHPLCRGRSRVTPAQLREAALVSVTLPPYGHGQLRRLLGCRPGESLPFQVECNDFRALTRLACHSDAVLLAPARALKAELEAGALVALDLAGSPAMTVEFVVVHLAQRTLSPAAERAVTVVVEAAA
ncbi:LysR family transcriptional regulator [Cupriavidus basilensis]|uniref:LysR family transcriptional regulator n=1 Tax=Cupriavidus basilensis TaxID=68895 RepID=A0ABT6AHP9_9BURK|nr:LysR family transcriptional regulator [Cupriavidus basilensis]MDF3832120.1 LysR family transcriptional regulator [Cupriavidus basilensis]